MQWRGRITKKGRRDLRRAMMEAAHKAVRHHAHWKVEYERLCRQTTKSKAKVAIARKLLIAVWHVLTKEEADRFASEEQIACALFALAYKMGVNNLPDNQSAAQFTRSQLDRLEIGQDIIHIKWGTKRPKLPPSKLK